MYQGKFQSNKGSKQAAVNAELIASRNAAAQQQKAQAQQPRRAPAQPAAQRPAQGAPRTAPQRPVPQQSRAAAPAEYTAAPEKTGPRLGGVIFYTFYFLLIFAFAVSGYFGLQWLNGWLVDFEAAQPTTICEEVFQQLFGDPDWSQLYDMAGVADTPYEGKDAFVSYMQQRVGDQELTYQETSGGLEGKKYYVKLGDERIGSFTLQGGAASITDIPDWKLGKVELFFQRTESYKIQKLESHTAHVNGVALDDSFTIQIATTKVEDYLPEGVVGGSICTQQIEGLMVMPQVTVTDEAGNAQTVTYDESTRTFVEETPVTATISEEEKNVILGAAHVYGNYMVRRAGSDELRKYFDSSCTPYKTIVSSELFSTKNNGVNFANESVTEYYRYSDTMFSARVIMTVQVTRTDGTIKDIPLDETMFFTYKNNRWLCTDKANGSVQTPVGKVRLRYFNGDVLISSDMVQNDVHTLKTPVLTAPDGKVFAGWFREDVGADGKPVWSLVFSPDENGSVTLPSGTILEPMTLHALFEDASAVPAETTAETTETTAAQEG